MFWGKFRAGGVSKPFVLRRKIDIDYSNNSRVSIAGYANESQAINDHGPPRFSGFINSLNLYFNIEFWKAVRNSDHIDVTVTGKSVIISHSPEGFCAKALGLFGIKCGTEFYSSGMGVTTYEIRHC
ncbi:hypothetical protein Cyrtocomes_00737 [Candidatus Cyrtobacter comes]|uniref:Uncharacterized protein n=1 Tax=Candidatus Cyrtobacter comes TaxID=675776 RepID=A0ABU5L8B5_9RICK|nr:hypothetical protein [Candidatus Cyrtobacter comes]MDZ5762358.1 hypothetical protein [Candidatus Cyrtobacter comes]